MKTLETQRKGLLFCNHDDPYTYILATERVVHACSVVGVVWDEGLPRPSCCVSGEHRPPKALLPVVCLDAEPHKTELEIEPYPHKTI